MYAWQFTKALYLADRHDWTRFVSSRIITICSIVKKNERAALPSRGHRCTSMESARAWTSGTPVVDREHKTVRDGSVPDSVSAAEKGFASVAIGPYSVALCDYP